MRLDDARDRRARSPSSSRSTPSLVDAIPGELLVRGLLFLVLPGAVVVGWPAGAAAVRFGVRRPWLAVAALALLSGALVARGPGIAAAASAMGEGLVGIPGGPVRPSWALLGPVAAWFGRWAVLTSPLAVPCGLLVAAMPERPAEVPGPEWQQARAQQRAEGRRRRKLERLAEGQGRDPRSTALAVSLGGNLDAWRVGDLVVPPSDPVDVFDLPWLLIGQPGTGKSTLICRQAYLLGRQRRHLVVVDAKGGPDGLARDVVAAYLAGWQTSGGDRPPTVRLFPNERLDIWRGGAQAVVNRLVEVWDWTAESSWYREVAMTALRLALGQPGPPCRSSAELVRRLEPGRLERAWDGDPDIRQLVRSMAKGKDGGDLAGVQVRVGNLVAALGGALDGVHSWEDADCWVVTVPVMVAPRDGDACLRVLLADYAHFTMARKGRRPSSLIVDEFAAIAGGRRAAIELLERGRGSRSGVVLSGQSVAALGDDDDRARLLAAALAVAAFRSPSPAELAGLAGSERVPEVAWQLDAGELTGAGTVTLRSRSRVDQDALRQLGAGEADLIVEGRRERIRVIRTVLPRTVVDQAAELVAGEGRPPTAGTLHPSAPVDAVDDREVPAMPAPPQGQAASPSPPATLDPGPSRPVRRYRPPPAGEGHPPDDRPGGAR